MIIDIFLMLFWREFATLIRVRAKKYEDAVVPSFRITISRKDDLDAVHAEVMSIYEIVRTKSPLVNPLYISIFEHTLSENGVFHLQVTDEDDQFKIELKKTVYSSDRDLEEFDNWLSALAYIQKHHYYELNI